jgi:hypothetical protein
MALIDIDGALIQGYIDMGLGLSTAYEGADFKPPYNDKRAAIFIIPASSDPVTLGASGMDEHLGFMQINFDVRPGTGRAQLLSYAQSVRDNFIAGESFIQNSQKVTVESVSRSPIRHVDGWMRISISVNWIARTIRPEIT